MPYLVERVLTKSVHFTTCDDLKFSLELAAFAVKSWIWQSQCDPDLAEKLMALIDAGGHREALETWNSRYPDRAVSIHEFEVVRKDCQHDFPEPECHDIYYLAELLWEDFGIHGPINSRDDAFGYVGCHLKKLTSRNTSMTDAPCSDVTRERVRSLLRHHQYADAIDAWNISGIEPKIALHKIRHVGTIL